jgi:hypothetical protein
MLLFFIIMLRVILDNYTYDLLRKSNRYDHKFCFLMFVFVNVNGSQTTQFAFGVLVSFRNYLAFNFLFWWKKDVSCSWKFHVYVVDSILLIHHRIETTKKKKKKLVSYSSFKRSLFCYYQNSHSRYVCRDGHNWILNFIYLFIFKFKENINIIDNLRWISTIN